MKPFLLAILLAFPALSDEELNAVLLEPVRLDGTFVLEPVFPQPVHLAPVRLYPELYRVALSCGRDSYLSAKADFLIWKYRREGRTPEVEAGVSRLRKLIQFAPVSF